MPLEGSLILAELPYLPHRGAAGGDGGVAIISDVLGN